MGLPATTAELAKTTFKPVQSIKPELTLLNGWDTAQEAQAPEFLIKGILEANAHGIIKQRCIPRCIPKFKTKKSP